MTMAATPIQPLPPLHHGQDEATATDDDSFDEMIVTINTAALLSNLRRDADDDDAFSFSGGPYDDSNDAEKEGDDRLDEVGFCPAERHFIQQDQSMKALIVLCRGMKDESGDEVIDFENKDKAPWNTIDKKHKPIRSDYIHEIKRRWRAANPNDKRVGSRPGAWKVQECLHWFNENPISDHEEVAFLKAKIDKLKEELIAAEAARLADRAAAADEQNGKSWTGKLPMMRLLHCILDVEENSYAFRHRNDLSNSRTVLDARNSEDRLPTGWEKVSDTFNDITFNPASR